MKALRALAALFCALFATAALAQTQPAPTAVNSNGSNVATQPVSLFVAPTGGAAGKGTAMAYDNPIPVSGDITMITVAPTVTASSAYASGNVVGGLLTFNGAAMQAQRGGLLQSVAIHFKSAQTTQTDFAWCGASNLPNTTLTDKSAVSVAVADFDKCRVIHLSDCTSLGTPSVCSSDNLAFPYTLTSGTTAYGFLITRGTPTFGSTSDVLVSLRLLRQ